MEEEALVARGFELTRELAEVHDALHRHGRANVRLVFCVPRSSVVAASHPRRGRARPLGVLHRCARSTGGGVLRAGEGGT